MGLTDVTVVGNSMGGWIAAEMVLLHSASISSVIIVDGVGIEVPGSSGRRLLLPHHQPVAKLSYHDPEKFGIDVSKLPPAALAAMAGNRASLAVYAGTTMGDPNLAGRLAGVTVPALVLWGEADRIGDPDFGRAFAAAIPGARLRLLAGTGHLPKSKLPSSCSKRSGPSLTLTAPGPDPLWLRAPVPAERVSPTRGAFSNVLDNRCYLGPDCLWLFLWRETDKYVLHRWFRTTEAGKF